MNIDIDFASEDDFEEISFLLNEISQAIISASGRWSKYSVNSDKSKQRQIYDMLIKSNNKLFLAKINGKVVGCVNLQLIQNIRHGWLRGHLEEVVVKLEYRGKGIGTMLMKSVKDYCKRNNIKMIKVMCGKQLKESHKFYEKNGFKYLDRGYRLAIN